MHLNIYNYFCIFNLRGDGILSIIIRGNLLTLFVGCVWLLSKWYKPILLWVTYTDITFKYKLFNICSHQWIHLKITCNICYHFCIFFFIICEISIWFESEILMDFGQRHSTLNCDICSVSRKKLRNIEFCSCLWWFSIVICTSFIQS